MKRLPVGKSVGRPQALRARPEFWLFLLLLGMQVTLIWSYPQIPTKDGPAHKYSTWVYRQLTDNESSELARYFEEREDWLFPNASYSLFLVQASKWLSLDQAEKLACSLYLIALAVSFRFFFESLGGRAWLPQFLLLTLTLNYLFFMGWLNFLWGVSVALVSAALTYRLLQRPALLLAVLSNLSLVMAYWSHLVSFCLGLISAVVLTATAGRRRLVAGCAGWLPAAVFVAVFWSSSANAFADWQYRDTLWERLWRVVSFRVATSFAGAEIPVAAALGLLLLALAVVVGARNWRGSPWSPFVVLSLVMLFVTLTVPRGAGAGFFIDDRVSFFFWLLVFCVVGGVDKRVARIATAAAVALCVVQTVHLGGVFRRFNQECSIFASGIDRIPEGADVFAYSFIEGEMPGAVQPFTNPNHRLALAIKSPNYHHYQADPRHSGHFLVSYTEDGLSRYVGERSFSRIHPSEFAGFLSYVVVWGLENPVESVLTDVYGYEREFENAKLRLYRKPGRLLEADLEELSRSPDPVRRRDLVERIVQGRVPDLRALQTDRMVVANTFSDQWTRGTRPAAVLVINRESESVVPLLRVRGSSKEGDPPMTFFVEDGDGIQGFDFSGPRARKINLSPVAPDSTRLFVVWTDRGWSPAEGYSPRRLGARLMAVPD